MTPSKFLFVFQNDQQRKVFNAFIFVAIKFIELIVWLYVSDWYLLEVTLSPRVPTHIFYRWEGGGGGRVQRDFFGPEILAIKEFFGSMKDVGIFLGYSLKNTGIFFGCYTFCQLKSTIT